VPVQTQLGGLGRIAAHFEEQRAEAGIVNVEIVVIDVDRLVAREPELPVDLLALESLRLLLRHAHEYYPSRISRFRRKSLAMFALCHGLHGLAELLRYLPQHDRRMNRLAQLFSHEGDRPTRGRQGADVTVQVQPVQAFHLPVSQQAIPVAYGTIRIDIGFRAGLIVEDRVIVEIKSVEAVAPVHKKQLLTYLRLADKRLGLPINFNAALIKDGISRIVNGLEAESHAKPQGRQENQ
jgi:GxxExxY protein